MPRNLASLWTTYEFQDERFKGLKVGAGYTYHGSQPIFDVQGKLNGAAPLLPSWGTVDLMAAYSFTLSGLKTTAQLNATNIFDKTYYTAGTYSTSSGGLASYLNYGPPFAVVGSLRVEF